MIELFLNSSKNDLERRNVLLRLILSTDFEKLKDPPGLKAYIKSS